MAQNPPTFTKIQVFSNQLKTNPEALKLFTTPAIPFLSLKSDNARIPEALGAAVHYLMDGKKADALNTLLNAKENMECCQISCETKPGVLSYSIDSQVLILTKISTDILIDAVQDKDILPNLKEMHVTLSKFSKWSKEVAPNFPQFLMEIENLSVETGKRADVLLMIIQAMDYDSNEIQQVRSLQ